nr:Integrator complex subunit 6 [Polyrhizophydium stewartii]
MQYIFVVDTSASMNAVFSDGLSALEVAKSGIEHFFKVRSHHFDVRSALPPQRPHPPVADRCRPDAPALFAALQWELRKPDRRNRYALVTFDDSPLGFKALFKDAEHELLDCVRSLQATDLSNASQALASVFDLLSAHRLRSRMDVPGLGRFPGGHESTLIFWFTDGGRLSSAAGVADRISIPGLRIPGCEFFIEPFRWEQRLFTIVLQPDTIPLAPFVRPMSDAMGGEPPARPHR